MIILFARHGETAGNALRIRVDGRFDEGLNETGWKQAEELARNVPQDIDVVISSRLLRTRQTAQVVAGKLDKTIEVMDGLEERDMGTLSGTRNDDWPVALHEQDRMQRYEYTPYGGESVEQVRERVMAALNEVKARFSGKKVLVVSHGGIIRLLRFLRDPANFEIEVDNAGCEEFEV